jgi:hypothetical protein
MTMSLFVLFIIQILVFLVPPLAIIFGAMGIRSPRRRLAIAGLVMGIVSSILLIIAVGTPFFSTNNTYLNNTGSTPDSSLSNSSAYPVGTIEITSVSPTSAQSGIETTFSVTVEYASQNTTGCIIYVGANTETADRYSLYDEYILPDTSGTYTFNFTCIPKAWAGYNFGIYVNISEYPHPDSWNPFDSDVSSINLSTRIASIELNATEVQLAMGETFQLTAKKYPTDSDTPLIYSTSSEKISIDDTGLIRAPAYSDQTISLDAEVRVSSGEISESVIVYVTNPYRWEWGDEGWNKS